MADLTTSGDHGADATPAISDRTYVESPDGESPDGALDLEMQTEEQADDFQVEQPTASRDDSRPEEGNGSRAQPEQLVLETLRQNEPEPEAESDSPRRLPALTSLAASRILEGATADAAPLLARILAITASPSHGNDPDIVILVNDLARLCLSESAYELAEPLLLRLLEWKQNKGEDHPEVATVLASLAQVRQTLGHHASSEELWRRVLDIRERTLAPNHFAIATALEHLAEACAARGKVGEAVELFQRARTIRELTLGSQHPSTRAARERIADLQLQAQDFVEPGEVASPASVRSNPTELFADVHALASMSASGRDTNALPYQRKAPLEREAPSSVARDDYAGRSAPPAMSHEALSGQSVVPYRDVILSIKKEFDNPQNGETFGARATAVLSQMTALVRKRYRAFLVGLGVTTLLLVGQAGARTRNERSASKTDEVAARRESLRLKAAAASQASMLANAPKSDPSRVASAMVIPPETATEALTRDNSAANESERTPVRHEKVDNEEGSARRGKKDKAERRISIPNPCRSRRLPGCVPDKAIMHLDSVASAIVAGVQRSAFEQPALNSALTPRLSSENPGSYATPLPAQLIGRAPTPVYPPELTDRNGEVRVRFDVDTNGRPILSTLKVISSSDPLFTAAVRKVVPQMQFDPARTGGVDPHPKVDAVEIPFRFVRPKK